MRTAMDCRPADCREYGVFAQLFPRVGAKLLHDSVARNFERRCQCRRLTSVSVVRYKILMVDLRGVVLCIVLIVPFE